MRVVLDPNVIISALLSKEGAPAQLLVAWQAGHLEVLVSPLLLAELERALSYRKIRQRINAELAAEFLGWLAGVATMVGDPVGEPVVRSVDPGDDYLVALAGEHRAALVSGDQHLLVLAGRIPVWSPRGFLDSLD
jgi:putative PIN family toxin of toxin-antitoxin system